MVRFLVLSVIVALAAGISGCISPAVHYERKAERQIERCDKLLAVNQARYARKVVAEYTRFLRTLPRSRTVDPVKRRILLKRGEIYHSLGYKKHAQADFSQAAQIARTLQAPAAKPAKPARPAAAAPVPAGKPSFVPRKPGAAPVNAPKKRRRIFEASVEVWANLISGFTLLRDGPAGDGSTIEPIDDFDCSQLNLQGRLSAMVHPFPRISLGLDLSLKTVGGTEFVDTFHKYDGCVLPTGQDVTFDTSFFELSGLIRLRPGFPEKLGTAYFDIGARYTMFNVDFDWLGGGMEDTVDAFLPLVGIEYNKKLHRMLTLIAQGKLCGFYYSTDNFRVSTFYLELFGGGEMQIHHRLFLRAGIRYTQSDYALRRRGEEKKLGYDQAGLVVAFRLTL